MLIKVLSVLSVTAMPMMAFADAKTTLTDAAAAATSAATAATDAAAAATAAATVATDAAAAATAAIASVAGEATEAVAETVEAVAFEITGDAAKGEKTFKKCKACHAVGEGAANKAGPVLNNIVGRAFASGADFEYSDIMKSMAADGATWTPENLVAFLEKPKKFAAGTKMSFAGLRKEDERNNMVAYLALQTTE